MINDNIYDRIVEFRIDASGLGLYVTKPIGGRNCYGNWKKMMHKRTGNEEDKVSKEKKLWYGIKRL